jgi:hypothetical protein
MATPTFTSITPDTGLPGGKYLVTIVGTNFELPPAPASTGFVGGTYPESMQVEIDGRLAQDVKVYSSSLLTCVVPSYRGDPDGLSVTPGVAVDLTLRNVTGPEEDTFTGVFTFTRQDYTRAFGSLAHVVNTLISELRRQVLNNVAVSTSVDFDGDTANALDIVEIAETPALALFGPSIVENKFRREQKGSAVQDIPNLEFTKKSRASIADLSFELTVVSNSPIELLQLNQEVIRFFERNQFLEVPQDSDNPNDGDVEFDMVLVSWPTREGNANNSDQHNQSSTFEIRGVLIDEDTAEIIDSGYTTDDPADVSFTYETKDI